MDDEGIPPHHADNRAVQRLQQIAAARREGGDQPALERSAAGLRLVPYREGQFASGRAVLLHFVVGQPLAVAPQAHNVDQHQRPVDREPVRTRWWKFAVLVMPRVYIDGDARPRKNVTEVLVGATVSAMEFQRNATENVRGVHVLRRHQGSMTRYWVLGLILAVAAVIYLVRRIRSARNALEDQVDIPLWEAEQYRHVELGPESTEDREDTAPAVLSPPEWKPPRS